MYIMYIMSFVLIINHCDYFCIDRMHASQQMHSLANVLCVAIRANLSVLDALDPFIAGKH